MWSFVHCIILHPINQFCTHVQWWQYTSPKLDLTNSFLVQTLGAPYRTQGSTNWLAAGLIKLIGSKVLRDFRNPRNNVNNRNGGTAASEVAGRNTGITQQAATGSIDNQEPLTRIVSPEMGRDAQFGTPPRIY
jgi:hypothetical protein